MADMRRLAVEAKNDLLEGFIKDPVTGLIELVWNALDADASRVSITVETNRMGGVEAVVIEDDGTGMTEMDATRGFRGLGGSWKSTAGETPGGRQLHGRRGRGRYAAYGIGERVVWDSVAEEDSKRTRVRMEGTHSDLQGFQFEDAQETSEPLGTTVRITLATSEGQTALLNEKLIENLTAIFALYLKQYQQVEILWNGRALDPAKVIDRQKEYTLSVHEDDDVTLTVIEWNLSRVDRAIFLCDAQGMAVAQVVPRIRVGDFRFTAYVAWDKFRELKHDWMLADLGEGEGAPVLEAARKKLREHFNEREDERRREVIDQWRNEEVYPYKGEAKTGTEIIKRETFDVVALAASHVINGSKTPGKKLALTLMKEALESSPSSLRRVLEDVIGLSEKELSEFDELLDRTSLSNVLKASRVIGDRLDFLALLDVIIWDKEPKKATLERRHLHKLLEREPWVFGEEWSVSTSDQRLSRVLHEHLDRLGEDVSVAEDSDDPVLLADGRDGRPDLVLWRAAEVHQNRLEHLVVELKRPSLKLTISELNQIEMYAGAVVDDNRFDKRTTRWEFWLIGDEVDAHVERRRNQVNFEPGVIQKTDQYTILVKLWSEVQRDAYHRHKFVQSNLDWEASRDKSVARMRKKYAEMLPAALLADEQPVVADETTEPETVS